MKNLLLLCCLSAIMYGCAAQDGAKQDNSAQVEQAATNQQQNGQVELTESDKIKSLTIKDRTDYAKSFIEELRQQPIGDVVLDGNKFVLDGETVAFPEFPMMKKFILMTAKKDALNIDIKIQRINQTSIEYEIEMIEGEASYKTKGTATITSTSMFLGSESDENETTQMMYTAYEYVDGEGDCFLSIRLGKDDEATSLLGRLIKNCNDKMPDIDLDFGMFTEK